MQISRATSEGAVFVLRWGDIERLVAFVANDLQIISITASCSDKLERRFSDISELRNFRNSERAAILELKVVAHDKEFSQRVSMEFNTSGSRNVRFYLNADESIAVRINDFYVDFIASLRPWYSWVSRANWYLVITGSITLMTLLYGFVALLKASSFGIVWSKDGLRSSDFTRGLLWGLMPATVGLCVDHLKEKFFPMGTFAFGDGEKRHERNEVIRTVLIGGFAVSVVSGVALSLF